MELGDRYMGKTRKWGYRFPDSNLKSDMRAALMRYVHSELGTKKKLDAFTLPADSLIFEEMLYEEFGRKLHVTAVEKDRAVFKRAKQIIRSKELPVALHHCEDIDFWNKNKKEFDFVWLDYCGPWSPGKEDVMSQLAAGDHLKLSAKRSPIVSLTLLEGMDLLVVDELKFVARKIGVRGTDRELLYKARLAGIPYLLNEEAKKSGNTILPLHIYRYRDKTRNSRAKPMLMFTFKVEKGINRYDVFKTPITDIKSDLVGDSSVP